MPRCVDGETGWFNGVDGAAGPVSFRVRSGLISGGLAPGGGASLTFNVGEGRWNIGRQKTSKRCDDEACKQ
jgi:hypothetical protein